MRRVVKRQQLQVRACEVRPGDYVRGPGSTWIEVLEVNHHQAPHAVMLTLAVEVSFVHKRRWRRPKIARSSLYTSAIDANAVLDVQVTRDLALGDDSDLQPTNDEGTT